MTTSRVNTRNKKMAVGMILATTPKDCFNTFAPLGLGYVAANIKDKLPGVRIILKEDIDDLINEKPDLIGISAASDNYYIAIEFAQKIKEALNIPVVIGGIHISLLPESLHDSFDIAVIGEGETTFVELLNSYLSHGGIDLNHLKKVDGLAFKLNGVLHQTSEREMISDLDSLPHPIIEELPYYNPAPHHAICLITSRGCPYKCSFCCSTKLARNYRAFSTETVVALIDYWVNKKNVKHIILYDDLLIANKKRLLSIIDQLESKNITEKCIFNCQVRANLIDDEICELLKRMNVVEVGMGVESFSDKILAYYNKSGCSGAINQQAIDCLHRHEISVGPGIILGAPGETKEDMRITLRAIYKNFKDGKIKNPGWGVLRPFPGTKIWDHAEEIGIVSATMDWKEYSPDIYLGEKTTKLEFIEIVQEWITKNTLILLDKPGYGGNFVHTDPEETWANAKYFYEKIKNRTSVDLGDEMIIDFIENPIPPQLINGYHGGLIDGGCWLSSNATVLIKYDKDVEITIQGHLPRNWYKSVFNSEMDITISLPDKSIIATSCIDAISNPDGEFSFKFTLPQSDFASFNIISSKSVIPKQAGLSADERELSCILHGFLVEYPDEKEVFLTGIGRN